jgi:hypothetical protein
VTFAHDPTQAVFDFRGQIQEADRHPRGSVATCLDAQNAPDRDDGFVAERKLDGYEGASFRRSLRFDDEAAEAHVAGERLT